MQARWIHGNAHQVQHNAFDVPRGCLPITRVLILRSPYGAV